MTTEVLLEGLALLVPFLIVAGMIKSDTGWLKRTLDAHIKVDDNKFVRLENRLNEHIEKGNHHG